MNSLALKLPGIQRAIVLIAAICSFAVIGLAQASVARAADKPIARFSVKPASTLIGKTVNFDGTASSDADGEAISTYEWSFGDGSSQTTAVPTTSHVYGFAGAYMATLTVIDAHGNSGSPVGHVVKISASYPVPAPPTARFTFFPVHPIIDRPVTLDASASSDADGDKLKTYRWSFGDRSGKTTSAPVIEHIYASTGTFNVKLVVVDSHGARSSTTSEKLTVTVPPPPGITRLHVRACVRRSQLCHRRGLYLGFTLSVGDQVLITIRRRHHRRTLKRVVLAGHSGRNSLRIRFAHMRGGRYVLQARAIGGGAATARFVWRVL